MDTRHGTQSSPTAEHSPGWAATEVTCNGRLAARSQFQPLQASALPGPEPTQAARPQKRPGVPSHVLAHPGPGVGSHAHRRREKPKHARRPDRSDRRWSWDALAYPDFRLYFIGSALSNLGTWLQNTVQVLLAYQLTHSVLAIGAVVCAQFSWVLLLSPWAGSIVSRFPSVQRLLIITQLASATVAAAMAALQFAGLLNEKWLIVGALGLGLAYCFTIPATSVLVPALIPRRESELKTKHQQKIQAALALDAASYNVGRFAAPLFAVLVVTRIGFTWAFALNAASFLALVVALAKTQPISFPSQAKITAGFRVVSREPKIRHLLAIVAAVTITADPVLVLGPALASHFGLPETWAGYFLSALGCGTLLGSLIPMPPTSKVRHAAYPLFLLGASIAVFALGFYPWLSLVAALVAGVACLLTNSVAKALVWSLTPAEQERPAVMAMWTVAWAGSKPLASLVDGLLATSIGVWTAGDLPSLPATGMLLALPALIPVFILAGAPHLTWLKRLVDA